MSPRKQTYGKRSRAIYDPFQAFVSPQRPAPRSNIRDQSVFVAEVVEELNKLKIGETQIRDGGRSGRKALGEKSVNETVGPRRTTLGRRRRGRSKVVDEDGADVENAEAIRKTASRTSEARDRSERHDRRSVTRARRPTESFEADNVPLFVDGHGYDTEVGEPADLKSGVKKTAKKSSVRDDSLALDTPSISILPPTPPAEEDPYAIHCTPLLGLSSHGITSFTEWSNQLIGHFSITKIAEASFGEVYRLSLLEDLSSFSHSDESVLKIIALKPPDAILKPTAKRPARAATSKKIEAMSKPADVANEVQLLQRMSTIPGFTNFRDVRIMQGRPAASFIQAFKAFNAEQKARKKDPSAFPDPAKKASYADDQLWAVIEMQDAGVDLERFVEQGRCQSVWAVWDVFWQVALTLGKGEEGAEFEHRDLHLGNVCVRQPAGEARKEEDLDITRKLNFTGLETTTIDYTISRARLTAQPNSTTRAAHANDAGVAYHDLSLPSSTSIFEGDSTEEYQYDIYRYMRGCVLAGDPYHIPSPPSSSPPTPPHSTTPGLEYSPWRTYTPRTNLIWLHYLLHSLLEQLHWPSATKPPPRKRNAGRDFARWKRAGDLEHVLLRVQEVLDPGAVCARDGSGLGGAGALVGWALEEGWLGVGDVVGEGNGDVEGDGEADGEGAGGEEQGVVVGEGDTLAQVEPVGKKAGDALSEVEEPAKTVRSRRRKA